MEQTSETPWYLLNGPDDDVIISSRLRLSRNLSDFVFPFLLSSEDKERIKALVSDAVNSMENASQFSFVDVNSMLVQGINLLKERNVLSKEKCDSIFMTEAGNTFIRINETDHIKMASYKAGFDFDSLMKLVYYVDEQLQNKVQMAASYDFGYLTAKVCDAGTGLKLSFWCFIPGIIFSKNLESIVSLIMEHKLSIEPVAKAENTSDFTPSLFEISTVFSQKGTEFDQLAEIKSIAQIILKTERKIRRELADNNSTIILNFVKQAVGKSLYSMLLSYAESLSIIAAVKFGLQFGMITGIEENELNSLIYKLKDTHLQILNQNYKFNFEEDIKKSNKLQIQRLRAVVLQDCFERLEFIR